MKSSCFARRAAQEPVQFSGPGGSVSEDPSDGFRICLVLLVEDPRRKRLLASSPGRIGTRRCSTIGPVSVPSSTKWTVQPDSFSPASRARRCTSRPGNFGRRAGWMFRIRPRQRATNSGREQAHVTGEADRGPAAPHRGGAASPARARPGPRTAFGPRRSPAARARARGQSGASGDVRDHRDDLGRRDPFRGQPHPRWPRSWTRGPRAGWRGGDCATGEDPPLITRAAARRRRGGCPASRCRSRTSAAPRPSRSGRRAPRPRGRRRRPSRCPC